MDTGKLERWWSNVGVNRKPNRNLEAVIQTLVIQAPAPARHPAWPLLGSYGSQVGPLVRTVSSGGDCNLRLVNITE